MNDREILKTVRGIKTSDGDGVKLTRIIGTPELNLFDPFLLLDEFKNEDSRDYQGGFPPHPHRGFETVTYMIAGRFTHRDSKGNEGHLGAGSVQWMTAGRGIIHSEMPAQENGLVWGFQLWLNLPAKLKMIEPKYQDIAKLPVVKKGKVTATVIAGEFEGTKGPGQSFYPMAYWDLTLESGSRWETKLVADHAAMLYVINGEVTVGNKSAKVGELATLSDGERLVIGADPSTRILFFSAQRLNEPIARGGPFVMNTKAEVLQAFEDYQNGKIGR